jgi:hypothetical protein
MQLVLAAGRTIVHLPYTYETEYEGHSTNLGDFIAKSIVPMGVMNLSHGKTSSTPRARTGSRP